MSSPPKVPASVTNLVIGAGVHGLSTAWHLAADGEDVLVVDKTGIAAGASGIACGVVRNNYFQPAMQELMAACVEVWESDPEALHYHPSGYIALGPPGQQGDLTEVFERQERIGYPSELHLGAEAVERHMRSLYSDWRAPGLTVCLHEHAGGFAFNKESMLGLADKARRAGAQIVEGVEVTGFEFDNSQAVTAVVTNAGRIEVEQVVVAVGPWVASLWEMLGLPARLDVRQPDGSLAEDLPMWTYWYLQEGEVAVDPATFVTDDGRESAVIHVDSDQPLSTDEGPLVTDEPWGIYFKPDRESVQGGAAPSEARLRVRGGPVPDRHRGPRLPRHVVGGPEPLHGPLRGRAAEVPPAALRRGGRLHGRQLPRVRPHAAERLRRRRLQPRLQDDRGRPRDRPGPAGRDVVPAAPVPLRALRDRGPAPRVEQPVPLVLATP